MRTQAVSCLAVRAYKHLGNAKCQDIASICKSLFGFFGFGFSSLRKFTRYCRSVSMPQHWTNSNSWIQVDPGGSRCSVPSAQCHAEWQISDGSWFTKAGILRHFSVNEAPVVQTSSSTHPMSSHVKVPQPHINDIQICLNSGNFLCHSDVQGFFSLKPHKAVLRTFPTIMRVSLAPSAALQPSSKCVITSYETSICTVCIWKTKNCVEIVLSTSVWQSRLLCLSSGSHI